MSTQPWKKCSSCKKDIFLKADYYLCNVSSCNTKRTGYVFCSMSCFERHVPGARHKDAFAVAEKAPASHQAPGSAPATSKAGGTRRIISSGTPAPVGYSAKGSLPQEVLIVATKLKDYIKARADYNTSGDVMDRLSEIVRREADKAIDNARADGRKTVMARDFRHF